MKSFGTNCGLVFASGLLLISIVGQFANADIVAVGDAPIGIWDDCHPTFNGKQINGCKKGLLARGCVKPKPNCRAIHKNNDVNNKITGCKCK